MKYILFIIGLLSASAGLSAQTNGRQGLTPSTTKQSGASDRSDGATETRTESRRPAESGGNTGASERSQVRERRSENPKKIVDNRRENTQERSGAARPAYDQNRPAAKSPKTVPSAPKKVAAPAKRERGTVNWLTLEQALEKSKTEKRKIYIDVYTDWCGWCKHMDSTTFADGATAKYLNERFYPVKFNAEQTADVYYNGKTWHFVKQGNRGYHELAAFWLNNKLSYPTSVFLDENQQVIQPLSGFLDAEKMEKILHYFGDDNHKKIPWETYERNYKK